MIKRLLLLPFLVSLGAIANPITTAPSADDANGIAEDQTAGGAGNLTLNGALVTGGIARIPVAQKVSIESAGNLSGVTFTLTCMDAEGNTFTEDVTGPNATTVTSTNYCLQVSQIAVDGAVGTNVEVGVLAANGSVTAAIPLDTGISNFSATLSAELVSGSGTFGMQYTVDGPPYRSANWQDAIDSAGAGLDPDSNTATGDVNVYSPVRAVRGKATAGTTGAYKFTVIQGVR